MQLTEHAQAAQTEEHNLSAAEKRVPMCPCTQRRMILTRPCHSAAAVRMPREHSMVTGARCCIAGPHHHYLCVRTRECMSLVRHTSTRTKKNKKQNNARTVYRNAGPASRERCPAVPECGPCKVTNAQGLMSFSGREFALLGETVAEVEHERLTHRRALCQVLIASHQSPDLHITRTQTRTHAHTKIRLIYM